MAQECVVIKHVDAGYMATLWGLGDYISAWQAQGQVRSIGARCSPVYEMAEIADRVFKGHAENPVLLFSNTGTPWPVAMNLYGTEQRMLSTLRAESYEHLAQRIDGTLETLLAPRRNRRERLLALLRARDMARAFPKRMRGRGPCQQLVYRNLDEARLPVLRCWPYDGGPYITLPMVITEHPVTRSRNVGMYRMQVLDGSTTAMHWQTHKTGAAHYRAYAELNMRMPVAVALGGDPLLAYCATAPLPEGVDEWMLAGFLRRSSVKLVRALTQDLLVPAEADFIIEGYVDPQEPQHFEGPFGDHTGFYSLEDYYPKFHVTCVTARRDAVYPATVVGVPPMEDAHMAKATERIFLPPLRRTVAPEICDMLLPPPGVAHNLALASVRRFYPGQSQRVANLFWSAGQMMFTKYVVTVDEGVRLGSAGAVLSALARHVRHTERVLVSHGPLDALDHSSPEPARGGKMLIDACAPQGQSAGGGAQVSMRWEDERLLDLPLRLLWVDRVLLLLAMPCGRRGPCDALAVRMAIAKRHGVTPRCVAIVDEAAPYGDPFLLLWVLLGNSDPAADVQVLDDEVGFTLVVDARRKGIMRFPRRWPNPVVSNAQTIARVDALWPTLELGPAIPSPSARLALYHTGGGASINE